MRILRRQQRIEGEKQSYDGAILRKLIWWLLAQPAVCVLKENESKRKGVRRGVDNSVSIKEISRLTQDLTEYFDCGLLEMAAVNWTDVLSSVVVV